MALQLYTDIACEGEMMPCEKFCSSSVGSLRQFTHVCRYPGTCSGIQLPIAHDACEYKCLSGEFNKVIIIYIIYTKL